MVDSKHVLIADSPCDFATAVTNILNNKDFATRLAENCHKYIATEHGIERLKKEGIEILSKIDI